MSELGSGSGSSYPSALDTNAVLEVNSPSGGKTKARAAVPNDIAAGLVAVQTELGTDPAGSLTDVKTYLQTEHETDGTHGAITPTSIVSSGAISGTSISTGDAVLKVKVIDIGDWDMDTTVSITVTHNLTATDIRHVSAIIRNDADTNRYAVTPGFVTVPAEIEAFIGVVSSTTVALVRRTTGIYDGGNYVTTSYNRGWVTIWYV